MAAIIPFILTPSITRKHPGGQLCWTSLAGRAVHCCPACQRLTAIPYITLWTTELCEVYAARRTSRLSLNHESPQTWTDNWDPDVLFSFSILFFKVYLFYFMCTYVCFVGCTRQQSLEESTGSLELGLWEVVNSPMRVLAIKPESSARAVNTLYH